MTTAWIAAETCYHRQAAPDLPPYRTAEGARQSAAAQLRDAVSTEAGLRRTDAEARIAARLAAPEPEAPVPVNSLRFEIDELRAELDRLRAEQASLREQADLIGSLAQCLRELAQRDRDAALPWIPAMAELSGELLAVVGTFSVFDSDAYKAAASAVEAWQEIGDHEEASDFTQRMLDMLSTMSDASIMQGCVPYLLTALATTGGLSGAAVDRIESLARSTATSDSWSPPSDAATEFAVSFAAAAATGGPPRLADLATEFVLLHSADNNRLTPARWYRPALQVLADLIAAGTPDCAARVATTLLARTQTLNWYHQAAVLGGLVRVGEATTADEAMRRFLASAAFIDHVHDLPPNLLHRLLGSTTFDLLD